MNLCVLYEVGVQFFLTWLVGINMTDHGFVMPPESHIIFLYFHGSLLNNWSTWFFYSTGLTCLLCLQDHWLSHVQLFETAWTEAFQVPLPMEFFRQEYWSRLPFSTPGNVSTTDPVLYCLNSRKYNYNDNVPCI